MKQVTLCVPLEVKPESASRLAALIEQFKRDEDKAADPNVPNFWRFHDQIPNLHFLSISLFEAGEFDPIFIIEANFDGDEGPFWAQLEALGGERLRAMLRCCKRPDDETATLYGEVTKAGSRRSIAPYLECRTQRPSVFHHGNRGLACRRIVQERALFLDAATELDRDAPNPYRGQDAAAVHAGLRAALLSRHPWLDMPARTRFPVAERLLDLARLVAFFAAVLVILALPGVGLLALIVLAEGWGAGLPHFAHAAIEAHPWRTLLLAAGGGIVLCAAVLIAWLRRLEKRDSANDQPKVDETRLREMVRREDWITQNHMGSIVLVKPGVLRTIIIRAGHLGLHLTLRATARSGYLGSMRTVHFAHWAFLNNYSRLLFFSNFDHSWDSYLDDFIEKAHAGLTLAWGCGVGFPRTRYLVGEGAEHGRQFKAWALASRTISRFWYSAYPDLTVDQVERNYRIADKLRKKTLGEREAAAWMLDL